MKTTFLDFEQAVAELETKIEELRYVQDESSQPSSRRSQKKANSSPKRSMRA
jgi:acetyl-CoA carboxylase carboxyl transferase subunit alpha